MKSQVTTKKGDAGSTVTITGERFSKSHPILECCGWLDTLRAYTALVRLRILASDRSDAQELGDFLFWLLNVYFLIGTQCNDPLGAHPEYRKGEVSADHLRKMEREQERLEQGLKLPERFIVSASNEIAAQCDLLCTVSRTFERSLIRLREAIPQFDADTLLAFANRLSDFLYVLARHVEDGQHICVDYDRLQDKA